MLEKRDMKPNQSWVFSVIIRKTLFGFPLKKG